MFGTQKFNGYLSLTVVCCLFFTCIELLGQEKKSSQPPSLVDGLLDLLGETEPEKASRKNSQPELRPADAGLDGVDVREHSDNPLEAARQNMLIVAGYLSKGAVNDKTRQLQNDIVLRLDDLIAEMEQSQQQNSSKKLQTQPQTQTASQEQSPSSGSPQPSSAEQSPTSQSDAEDSGQSEARTASPDVPGQQGKTANVAVDLVDPIALQESVWGGLPDQVRKQMQSRMVERFLPSYRQEIEAYFRALLENQKP